MKITVIGSALLFLLTTQFNFAQNRAYQLYTLKGKKTFFDKMLKKLKEADIILFGEYHNNPICHWLELEVAQSLSVDSNLILGAEMLERDDNQALQLYLNDSIDYSTLDSNTRLWSNFKTDYLPLLNFAKENNIPFEATNIPRRYASMVYKNGLSSLDTLRSEEKEWIAPLPFPYDSTLPGYQNMLMMMGDHANPNLPLAQAIKDATMAYFIGTHYKTGQRFLHINGSYHSNNFEGIVWYLNEYNPELKVATISTVSQSNIDELKSEHLKLADYIICIDDDMTTTY